MIIKLDTTHGGNVLHLEDGEGIPPTCNECARKLGVPFYYSLSTKKFSCTDCILNRKRNRISIVRILSVTNEDKQELIEYLKIIRVVDVEKEMLKKYKEVDTR